MQRNMMQALGANVRVSGMTPNVSATADAQISRTSGGATLSDLIAARSRRSPATNVSLASQPRAKVAARQWGKEGN
jgi:hypothetical protein